MAENVWYYATDNVQHGPFTFGEMQTFAREGRFSRTDLVWQPEFGNRWRDAETVPEFFPAEADGADVQPPCLSAPGLTEGFDADPLRTPVPLNGVNGEKPSVFRSASLAFRRMKDVLFASGSFSRWTGIAFCAWLYRGFTLRLNLPASRNQADIAWQSFQRDFHSFCDAAVRLFQSKEGIAALAGALGAILIFVCISLYLNSRGAFMFLHRWYRPDERLRTVWRNSRRAANRLFRWEVGFLLLFLLAMGYTSMYGYRNILQPYLANGKVWDANFFAPLVRFGCSASVVLLTYASVRSIVREFIVPVMYWQGCTVNAAWLSFFSLCRQRPFRLLGYYLLMYALFLAWFLVYLLAIVGSLFIGAILLALPYVGTVFLLPAMFFFRGYSLAFIHQWRKDLVPLD